MIWSRERSQSDNTVLLITTTKNVFTEEVKTKTRYAFTRIIPRPVTEYDTIFTPKKIFRAFYFKGKWTMDHYGVTRESTE